VQRHGEGISHKRAKAKAETTTMRKGRHRRGVIEVSRLVCTARCLATTDARLDHRTAEWTRCRQLRLTAIGRGTWATSSRANFQGLGGRAQAGGETTLIPSATSVSVAPVKVLAACSRADEDEDEVGAPRSTETGSNEMP